ncbi:hypothetical protein HMPREF0973_00609 [Prevotella veroralis F0319]|uniref:Uncharacterized protein n=1 Tax=Prevotella veroralis F0319 TaxID=649761 RepID=C9MLY3_9BACT|nr:hypothetical protein HMPREF0973_00609 [Prevotella veroralis F0319]
MRHSSSFGEADWGFISPLPIRVTLFVINANYLVISNIFCTFASVNMELRCGGNSFSHRNAP